MISSVKIGLGAVVLQTIGVSPVEGVRLRMFTFNRTLNSPFVQHNVRAMIAYHNQKQEAWLKTVNGNKEDNKEEEKFSQIGVNGQYNIDQEMLKQKSGLFVNMTPIAEDENEENISCVTTKAQNKPRIPASREVQNQTRDLGQTELQGGAEMSLDPKTPIVSDLNEESEFDGIPKELKEKSEPKVQEKQSGEVQNDFTQVAGSEEKKEQELKAKINGNNGANNEEEKKSSVDSVPPEQDIEEILGMFNELDLGHEDAGKFRIKAEPVELLFGKNHVDEQILDLNLPQKQLSSKNEMNGQHAIHHVQLPQQQLSFKIETNGQHAIHQQSKTRESKPIKQEKKDKKKHQAKEKMEGQKWENPLAGGKKGASQLKELLNLKITPKITERRYE
jgi:hypothetical protein